MSAQVQMLPWQVVFGSQSALVVHDSPAQVEALVQAPRQQTAPAPQQAAFAPLPQHSPLVQSVPAVQAAHRLLTQPLPALAPVQAVEVQQAPVRHWPWQQTLPVPHDWSSTHAWQVWFETMQ